MYLWQIRTTVALMVYPSFEILALRHKNFGNLLENAMINSWKGVIQKSEPMNCDKKFATAKIPAEEFCESVCLRVVSYISLHSISNLQIWLSKFTLKVLFYSRWQMMKVSHISPAWLLYFTSQIYNNVIAIFGRSCSSWFFARNPLKLEAQLWFDKREQYSWNI